MLWNPSLAAVDLSYSVYFLCDILWREVQLYSLDWWHMQLLHVLHVHSLRLAHQCHLFV